MSMYAALLRGVNVGGHAKVPMADLRALFASLGLDDVATYVQSGNVVFSGPQTGAEHLRTSIEDEIRSSFGIQVTVLLRSARQLKAVVRENPFPDRTDDQAKLLVTFLADRPSAAHLVKLPESAEGADRFAVSGTEIYLWCPTGYGKTKFGNAFFESRLSTRATTRNWRTVVKLVEMTS
jgi:uncharacterized protein (DUF1697 family)